VSKRFLCVALMILAMLVAAVGSAYAMSANVVMKVSRTAQDSVINAGEDLTIDIQLDGVEPAMYKWYFEDALIEGADSRVYTLRSAEVEDAGIYRMEAYGEDGTMLASMEFAVRVIEDVMPQAGDDTLGIGLVTGIMGLSAAGMGAAVIRKKRLAA